MKQETSTVFENYLIFENLQKNKSDKSFKLSQL